MNPTRILIVVMALAALAAGAYWLLVAGRGGPDTIVLVTVGGLREDAVASTDALARLAADTQSGAVRVAVPLAASAAVEVLTGQDPLAAEAAFGDLALLPPATPTLASRLSREGYQTVAMVGDGRLSILTGLYRGFDQVFVPSSPFDQPIIPDESARVRAPRSGHIAAPVLAQLFAQRLLELPERGRVFVWLHFDDPSRALMTSQDAGASRDAYSSGVSAVGVALDGVVDALERAGRGADSTLVLCSLHGESLDESGELRHGLFPDDTTARVPLIVRGLPAGTALPASLRGVGEMLLASRDLEAESVQERGLVWRSSWLPLRSYAWEAATEVLEGQAWRPALPGEVGTPTGLPPATGPVDEEQRAAVLEAMRASHRAAVAGESEAALQRLAEARALAPGAMAPRRLALSIIRPSRGASMEQRARLREEILGEMGPIAATSVVGRIDFARALVESGERDAALDVALELGQDETLSRGQRWAVAELLASLAALEAAVDQAEQVADDFDPGEVPELHEWIGDKLARSGNAFRARVAYEKAAEVPRARSANLLAKLGDALQSLGEDEGALRFYGEAVTRDPTFRYPHLRAGEVFLKLGRFSEAAHALASSVPDTGRVADDALARARVLERRGMVRAAAGEIYEAAQEATGDPRLQVNLARLLVTAGDPARAAEFLNKVLEGNPNAPAALVQLARVRAAQGQTDEALRVLRKLEPLCGRDGARAVRADPLFVGAEADPRLAVLARSFADDRFPSDEGSRPAPAAEGW